MLAQRRSSSPARARGARLAARPRRFRARRQLGGHRPGDRAPARAPRRQCGTEQHCMAGATQPVWDRIAGHDLKDLRIAPGRPPPRARPRTPSAGKSWPARRSARDPGGGERAHRRRAVPEPADRLDCLDRFAGSARPCARPRGGGWPIRPATRFRSGRPRARDRALRQTSRAPGAEPGALGAVEADAAGRRRRPAGLQARDRRAEAPPHRGSRERGRPHPGGPLPAGRQALVAAAAAWEQERAAGSRLARLGTTRSGGCGPGARRAGHLAPRLLVAAERTARPVRRDVYAVREQRPQQARELLELERLRDDRSLASFRIPVARRLVSPVMKTKPGAAAGQALRTSSLELGRPSGMQVAHPPGRRPAPWNSLERGRPVLAGRPPGSLFITGEDEAPGYPAIPEGRQAAVVSKAVQAQGVRELLGTLFPDRVDVAPHRASSRSAATQ